MKIKLFAKSKRPLRPKQLLPWLPLATFVILLLLLSSLIYFLYNNFYQTIAQIKVVYILRAQVALTRVDTSLYRHIYTAWENKKIVDAIINTITTDPFRPLGPIKTNNASESLDQANQIMP